MAERTCLGCRAVGDKAGLVRLVSVNGVLTADPGSRAQGRGAYICPREECVRAAFRKKGVFSRALKCNVNVPPEEVLLKEVFLAWKTQAKVDIKVR